MKKKLTALALALVLALSLCLTGCGGGGGDTLTLNVYNWGEYISDGSDGSLDTIEAFETWYEETYGQKVNVNYTTFASNEDMYAKLKSGAVSYDVIIPSDYKIARLVEEDMLLPLNFDNIPNYQYIADEFRGLYYDPDDQYSVPYTYGVVGIIYDANQVDEADVGSWDLMWNEKYSGKILQFNNSRDAFGTTMYRLGIDGRLAKPVVHDVPGTLGGLLHHGGRPGRQRGPAVLLSRAHQLLCGRHVHPHRLPEPGAGGDLHQLHAQRGGRCGQRGVHLLRLSQLPGL